MKIPLILLLVIILALGTYGTARASIVLVVFEAFPEISDIYLSWRTSSETYNDGFYIQRSTQENGNYIRISELIPSASLGGGADYDYVDADVQVDVDYYYKLEAVDASSVSTFYGPIHAIIETGGGPSATSTSTGQATITPTKTATGVSGPTATFTRTSTPTATSMFSPTPSRSPVPSITNTRTPIGTKVQTATVTPVSTQGTVTATLSGTQAEVSIHTATLLPVPSIDLLFPVDTPASINDLPQVPTPTPEVTEPVISVVAQPVINTKTIILGVVVGLVWILLAGFIVIFVRKVQL